jgi:predicted phosphoribosyltransferase
MPGQAEYAIGALGSGGVRILRPGRPGRTDIGAAALEAVKARELAELQRRERAYRSGRAPLDLAGRRAILVDDGVATGSTMLAAIDVARRLQPATLTLALPVAPPDTVALLAARVDRLLCLASPPQFSSVGQWYECFEQVSDEEVQEMLARAWHDPGAPPAN